MKKIIKVTISHVHGLVLTNGGEVFGFGNNTLGRISKKIDLGNNFIRDISVGEVTSFAISKENDLYGWGYNKNFLLDDSDLIAEITPKQINLGLVKVKKIAISKIRATIISTDDELYSWGSNIYYDTKNEKKMKFKQMCVTKISNKRFYEIESFWNSYHTIVLGYNKKIYGFGGNHYGQLRIIPYKKKEKDNITNISNRNFINKLRLVDTSHIKKNIKQIKVIENNTIIVTEENKVFICGNNTHGELYNSDTKCLYKLNNQFVDFSSEFVELKLGNIGVKEIKCDDNFYYLVDNDNYMYKWKHQQKVEVLKLSDTIMSVNFMGNKRQYMLTHKNYKIE